MALIQQKVEIAVENMISRPMIAAAIMILGQPKSTNGTTKFQSDHEEECACQIMTRVAGFVPSEF